jgi:hypothetical protein
MSWAPFLVLEGAEAAAARGRCFWVRRGGGGGAEEVVLKHRRRCRAAATSWWCGWIVRVRAHSTTLAARRDSRRAEGYM